MACQLSVKSFCSASVSTLHKKDTTAIWANLNAVVFVETKKYIDPQQEYIL